MASDGDRLPAFFEDDVLDPVKAATGVNRRISDKSGLVNAVNRPKPSLADDPNAGKKKKAGYYLSVSLLERFTRKFHELKLAGIHIENKSALIEAALTFALDDIDQGASSKVLQGIQAHGLPG